MTMTIADMKTLNAAQLTQAAQILTDELPLGWATLEEAMQEVRERLSPHAQDSVAFVAALMENEVIGWCGLLSKYDGKVCELHPLAVRRDQQRKGVGSALVRWVEGIARQKGALTLWLGADDELPGGETSLANADLYDDLPRRIAAFDPGTHQAAFYIKNGFSIVGVMPDANGRGKPDIYMAKRL